jgi:hypothetical protein
MTWEELLDYMADVATLFISNCLKNVNVDWFRHKDFRGFK